MELLNNNILSILTFVPLLAALGALASPTLALARLVAMGGSILAFLASLHVWFYFDPQTPGLQFVEAYEWMPAFGIKYIMGVDGLNLLLIVLTTFLTPLILISQWNVEEKSQKAFFALFMALECG